MQEKKINYVLQKSQSIYTVTNVPLIIYATYQVST